MASGEPVRRRVVAHGRVQAVGFRAACAAEAERRGVAGWVANRREGTVEAAFEGAPEAVEALVDWTRRGPAGAQVDDVTVSAEEPEGQTAFVVR